MMEPGSCGDRTVDLGETCDSNQSGCVTPEGAPGVANCKSDCSGFDTCVPNTIPTCGNASREPGETCDSDSIDCTTQQGYPGTQSCSADCASYGTCETTLVCGDGICSAGIETPDNCASDCMSMPVSNDRTREAGVVIRVQGEVQGYPRNNLIDDDPATVWRDDASTTWIEVDFSGTSAGAYAISDFSFTSAGDSPEADPSWVSLIATNGNGDWVRLGDFGPGFTERGQRRQIAIDVPASYRMYRFDMGNRGGSFTQIAELEMLEAAPAVCGNGTVDANEVCDGNSRTCSAPNGYPGTERCNPGCTGFLNCTTTLSCGDGVCTPGPESNATCPQDCPPSNFPPPPVYSGTCPSLHEGTNANFMSLGRSRSFELRLPPSPIGAPVVFAWHALNATPQDAMVWSGIESNYMQENYIVVAPYSCCASEWVIGGNVANNPDVQLFDDVLACLIEQYSVDIERIYTTGFSAGGLYASYLLQVRSGHLAAAAPFSGGLLGSYVTPAYDIPVLLTWGGSGDLYGSFSFETASLNLSAALRNDGNLVIECNGNHGHSMPNDAAPWMWRFFEDHPRGVQPDPYANAIPPGTLPNICHLP